jgi:hypothetical protein
MTKILAAGALLISLGLSGCTTYNPFNPTGEALWLPSPHPHPPEYDVWVRGEYVGSDPDERIRWSLRQEWKRSYNLR